MRALLAALLAWGAVSAPAHAQWERPWASADGAVRMTLPEMWNIVANDDPDLVLFVRSLGNGPAGPAEIVCAVEKQVVPQDVTFDREQLNAITPRYSHATWRRKPILSPRWKRSMASAWAATKSPV